MNQLKLKHCGKSSLSDLELTEVQTLLELTVLGEQQVASLASSKSLSQV